MIVHGAKITADLQKNLERIKLFYLKTWFNNWVCPYLYFPAALTYDKKFTTQRHQQTEFS